MKLEIVSRWSGAVLFSIETVRLKLAVELGVKSGADLRGADLRGAILSEANLRVADLRVADLSGARGFICLGWDSRGYHFRGVRWADGWRVSAGCRWFTVPEAVAHWTEAANADALARVAILAANPA